MEKPQTEATESEAGKQDLYASHVEGFLKATQENLDQALDTYGFTIWHSMSPKEAANLKEQAGIAPLEAADFYNRGSANAMEGKWAEAEADLRAALKKDPDYAPAAFNLAVCLENLERFDEARKLYKDYLSIRNRAKGRRDLRQLTEAEAEEETARIDQHLETLGKS